MKQSIITILFILIFSASAFSQGAENVWVFGNKTGLDFNPATATSISNNFAPNEEGSASVCDASGQILFYTNGCWVWNRNHHLMPELTGGIPGYNSPVYPTAYPPLMPPLGFFGAQSAAITNVPGQPGKYYVFSLSYQGDLYYSKIDMSLNNGLGGIVAGKKGIGLATDFQQKMTVVKGCNNIWLMLRSRVANEYKAFEINDTGIVTTPVISTIGSLPLSWYWYGVIKFSPDGTKMVAANGDIHKLKGGVELCDFDPATGMLSNNVVLDSSSTQGNYFGACFSPDNTKLYISISSFYNGVWHYGKVRQFDLSLASVPAIIASNTLIYTDNQMGENKVGDLKRGRDGHIYFSPGQAVLHRIDFPNLAGLTCGVTPNAIPMTADAGRGLPNDVVILLPPDTVGSYNEVTVCFKDTAVLTAATGKNYHWSNGGTSQVTTITSSGLYAVRYIDSNCRYVIDTFNMSFVKLPVLGSTGYSCPAKQRGKAWCTPKTGNTETFTYTWKNAGGNILRQYSGNAADTLTGLDTGSYTVRITTQTGCDTNLHIQILPLPVPDVALIADNIACKGAPADFTGITDAPIWQWQFGDGQISEEKQALNIYYEKGNYTVYFIATNIEGCSDTAKQLITVKELDIKLYADKELINFGEEVKINSAATEPYTVLEWTPAELFSNQTALWQRVALDTTTTITIKAVSGDGCIGEASIEIAITPRILMPNAFTPNGDGLNDYFRLSHYGPVLVLRFEVYNRFGQMVYGAYGAGSGTGWDGTFKGKPCDVGTYFYHINLETEQGKSVYLKGDVTLLR